MAEKEPDTEESTEANKEGGGGDGGARWPGPRTVLVARTENGFGFTLRHFIVYPPDPAGSEQGSEEGDPTDDDGSDSGRRRKRTKLEPLDTIFVKHVKEGGPAQLSGLHTGDRIVSVNGHSVSGKSYSQVIGLIQQSDSSLKLLVVPRDEDVLQMAYQNSAYNHGQEPYRGSAGEIPEPPPSTYGGSRGGSASHRQTKPPLPPRYKSELKMVPEDDGLGRRTSGDGQPRWLGAHSSASSMGSSSSLGSSSHSKDPLDYRDPQALPSDVNGIGSGSAPGAPLRTSSKNIVLAHLQGSLDSGHRSGSVDSISRSSESSASTRRSADGGDGGCSSGHQPPQTSSMFLRRSAENVQHSSDNITGAADGGGPHMYSASRNGDRYRSSQDGVRHSREDLPSAEELSGPSSAPPMLKSVTTSRLPAAISGYRPTPSTTYGRSQTTSALLNSSSGQRQPTTAKFSSATYIKPYKPILATSDARTSFSSSSSSSSSSDLKSKHSPAVTRSGGDYRTPADQRDPWVPVSYDSGIQYSWPDVRKAEMSCGGPTVTVRIHDSGGGSGKPSPQRQRSGSQGAPTVTITAGRHSGSDRAINMVAERRKWFQSLDYPSSDQDRWGRLSGGSGGIDQQQQQSSPGGNTSTSITSTTTSPGMTEFRIEMTRGPPAPPPGVNDIVSNRIAALEASSEDNLSDGDAHRHRKLSSDENERGRRRGSSEDRHNRRSPHDDRQRRASREEQWKERERQRKSIQEARQAGWRSVFSEARPPHELHKVPSTPPATISIYFRPESSPPETATLQPSPERTLAARHHARQYSDSSDSQGSGSRVVQDDSRDRDRSPLAPSRDEHSMSPSHARHRHRAAVRQPSYLSAVNSPKGQKPVSHKYTPRLDAMDESCPVLHVTPPSQSAFAGSGLLAPIPFELMSAVIPDRPASDQDEADGTSGGPGVVLRQHSSPDEREAKLVRRTSYLMATNRDRGQPQAGAAAAAAAAAAQAEMSKSDSQLRQSPLSTSQIDESTEAKAGSTKGESVSEKSPGASEKLPKGPDKAEKKPDGLSLELPKDPGSIPPDMTTPTKTSNIRKLKAFFGEKTPRIVEATTNQQRCFDMPAASDIVKEGYLSCKMAISDGKRASDRSWKPMWAVLRGHALYMFKDKTSSPPVCDEQPISIKSSIVDIAYDYTKKKNVFRLTTYNGSEYLFQPDDHETMLDWIRVIQIHNNPDEDDKGVGNKELIVRKTVAYELASKTSPQPNVKSIKKTSTKSLRSKSPASHSPSSFKQRKQAFEKEQLDSPKGKDSAEKIKGTWKGKMAKRFRRHGSTVATPAELNGTFGIPLELCCPGTFSEHVPLVVELCTRIVEARGIENQGIYRVPGNTGAVNSLQDQLNQDPENIDMDNDKWLDVNVISSLLKLFFRKLPEPLITDELYESIINANRMDNSEKRMLHIKKILHELPECNFETFRYIAGHLSNVASMGHVNKMDARNLAIVFGPTLVRSTDETLVTMVKDMSDQCRIVESIILNHDWFFGSWDMDMYVPHDEPAPDAVPVSGMNQELLSKAKHLELGERGRDISAKDMITSIIGAANKIRRRDKSSTRGERDGTVIEPESDSEPAYNERDIDREIELRGIKEQLAQKSSSLKDLPTSSQSLSSSHTDSTSTVQGESGSERDGVFTAKRVLIQRKDSETSATTTSSITSEENVQPRLNRYPAYPAPDLGISFSTENSKPVRRFSEDILSTSERRGDDEIDYRPYRGPRGMTYATQQHLRRIAMETQALRQKEEERRIEQERRAIDRQRIELELAKTKNELEREESIEDLIAKQNADLMTRIPDGSSKFSDYSSKADSTSIASDYSTTSSTAYGTDNKPHSLHMQLGYVSDYSSSTSPTSVHGEGMRQSGVHRPVPYGSNKGRYNGDDRTKQSAPGSKGYPHAQDDIELYRHHSPRPVFDVNKIATKGTLTRKKSKSPTRRQQDQAGSDEYGTSLRHSGSLQRTGSLDSLRDFYDKPESNPYLSESDNDDNLVESLTSTFDEKLKKLLDPKPRFDPATSKRTPPVGSESTQHISPNPRPLSHSTPTSSHATESPSRYEVSFQNPSLHRMRDGGGVGPRSDREPSPSGEPERRSSRNSGIDRWGAPTSLGLCRDLGDATSSNASSPQRKLGSLVPEGANTSLMRWERENNDYAAQLRKSSERLYGSRERLLDVAPDPTGSLASAVGESQSERAPPLGEPSQPARTSGVKMRSASPPARRRASAAQKRVRRRHTVGGCSDYDHLAALAALNGQGPPPRSAWERLQPAVSPTEGEAKSIRDWCEKERLRAAGSSPAILSLTIQPAPADRQPLQGAPALPPRDGTRAPHFQRSKSQPPGGSSQTPSTYSGGGSRGRPSFTFESSI